MEDIYNQKNSYENEIKRLKRDSVSKRNKELIETFHKHLFSEGVSDSRVVKLSCQLRKLASDYLKKDFDKTNEKDIRSAVAAIHKAAISEATKSDYRRLCKQFYKWLEGKGKNYPEKVDWIKVKVKTNGKENIDVITVPEIKRVLEKCENERDRAFISLLYEGGFRVGEILTMKVRDVENNQHYCKVSVTGKTGPRRVVIVSSLPYLNQYLNIHPSKNNKDGYLWICNGAYRHNEGLKYIGACRLVMRAFARAGVKKKRLYLHLFRHSRATELASHLTEAQMKQYFGWVKNSDTPSVYVHMSGRDVDSAILGYYGVETNGKDKKESLEQNITCSRCSLVNPAEGKYCMKCGLALSVKVALETEEQMKEETNKTFQLLQEIMRSPELLKEFEQFQRQQED